MGGATRADRARLQDGAAVLVVLDPAERAGDWWHRLFFDRNRAGVAWLGRTPGVRLAAAIMADSRVASRAGGNRHGKVAACAGRGVARGGTSGGRPRGRRGVSNR